MIFFPNIQTPECQQYHLEFMEALLKDDKVRVYELWEMRLSSLDYHVREQERRMGAEGGGA